jgi:hypothetical protein
VEASPDCQLQAGMNPSQATKRVAAMMARPGPVADFPAKARGALKPAAPL